MSGNSGVLRGRDQETFLEVSLTGLTSLTLDSAQAIKKILRFTGSPSGAATVRLSLNREFAGMSWTFENLCDATITVAPLGGAGVDIEAGINLGAWFDGVDFIGQASAAAQGFSGIIGDAVTVIPIVISEPAIGDAITFNGTEFVNQPAAAFFQVILTIDDDYLLGTDDATEVNATNIELRAGTVAAPWRLSFPDTLPGKTYIVENQTGQPATLVGDDASEIYLVNNARCQVLWDGTTLVRNWLSTPTHFNIASADPLDFDTWDQVDADYIEVSPIGDITVNFPNGGSLGKRGRRIAIKNDDTNNWIDIKTAGAGADKTTRLLPGETASFIIDDSGAIVPDWTRAYERRVTVTHDDSATYTVVHPDFLAQVIVVTGDLSATRNLVLPTVSHHSWLVTNTCDEALVVKTAAGGGITVLAGNTAMLACDGTDIVALAQAASIAPRIWQRGDGQVTIGPAAVNNPGITETLVINATTFLNGQTRINDTVNVELGTGTGTQWGTSPSQKQSWFGAPPATQQATPTGTDTQKIDGIIAALQTLGFLTGTGPLSGAFFRLQSDDDVREFDGTVPEDGERVHLWVDAGSSAAQWNDGDEAMGIGPLFESGGGDLINGLPVLSMTSGGSVLASTPGDNTQSSWSFYFLLNADTGYAGDGVILDNGTGASVRLYLYLDRAGQIGYHSDGNNVDMAAVQSGLQVLAMVFEAGVGVTFYRDGVSIGTNAEVDPTGYDFPGPCFLFAQQGNTNKTQLRLLDAWGYKAAHDAIQVAQQTAYLTTRGGL